MKIFFLVIVFLVRYYYKQLVRMLTMSLILSREIIRMHHFDKKYKIDTRPVCHRYQNHSLHHDGIQYQPATLNDLILILNYLKLKPGDAFVDFGCGKGRVVFYVALQNVRKVIGIEINEKLINIANRNLANFKFNKAPIQFIECDAANFEPTDENIFFFNNPFGYETMSSVLKNIERSLLQNPRQIRIIYFTNYLIYLLQNQEWLTLEKRLIKGVVDSCCIWRNKI